MQNLFTIPELCPIRDSMTISRNASIDSRHRITYFSMGKETSISPERYDHPVLYLGAFGTGNFLLESISKKIPFTKDSILLTAEKTLCGMETQKGLVYTEIILEKENTMSPLLKTNEAFCLKDLIDYEENSIANLDVVTNPSMKYVLMAFDKGTGLSPHRAPGNAIVFALDGSAQICYENETHVLHAGECFLFEKNGLHSVDATERFKMALLLVME